MKNPRIRRSISSLLTFSFILWSTGCYSTKEVARLDPQSYPLEVVRKGNRRYTFESQWRIDSLGAVSGVAQWKYPSAREPLLLRGKNTFPSDSISTAFVENNEIVVVTKDNSRIALTKWMSDGSGGIAGISEQHYTIYSYDSWEVARDIVSSRRIPADSIVSIQKSEFSPGKTALLIAGGVVAGGVILLGTFFGNALQSFFSFGWLR